MFALVCTLAAVGLLVAGCGGGGGDDRGGGPGVTDRRGLLLITIDTCRVDRIGSFGRPGAGTPCLDRLSRDAAVFERAYAHTPLTLPSHSSILTGLLPLGHGVRDNGIFALGEDALTLADALAAEGFATGGFVGGFPLARRFGLAQSFDVYDDDFSVDPRPGANILYSERRGQFVVDAALRFLEQNAADDLFLWTHFYDPHARYDPVEPFDAWYEDDLYQGEIAYTDHCIEKLLEGLDRLGRLDDFTIVITADHGEGLGEHGEETHGIFVYEFAVRVPLLIAGKGLAGGVRDGAVARHIDLMPTMLDLVGVDIPDGLDGVSLVPRLRGASGDDGGSGVAYFESYALDYQYGWSKLFGVARGKHKWIDAPTAELYDLVRDPLELRNLAGSADAPAGVAAGLETDLDAIRRRAPSSTPARTRVVDSDERRRLAELGYVQDGGTRPGSATGSLLDPKEAVPLFNQLNDAQELAARGQLEEAEPLVRSILEQNPDNSLAWTVLANVLFGTGRLEAAVDANRQAIARNPTLAYAYRNIGKIRLRQQRFEEAEEHYATAIELEPEAAKGRLGMARVLLSLDRRAEAMDELMIAAKLEPHEYALHYELGEIFARLGRPEDALAAYERSVRAPPSSPTPYLKIGSLLTAAGDLERACEVYEGATAIFPESAPLHNARGMAQFRADRPEAAAASFRRALELAPDGAAASNLATVLVRGGRVDEAVSMLRDAAAIEQPNPKTLRTLGILLVTRVGESDEGARFLRRYLAVDPADAEVRALLDRIE